MTSTTILLISIFMGFVPMILYTAIMWWIDHWEREPKMLIISCFLWGAVPSIFFAVAWSNYFETAAGSHIYGDVDFNWLRYSVIAPVTEECAKGLGLLVLFLFFRREIDSLLDGILYGTVIGFGFAAVENVFYFVGFGSEEPQTLKMLIFLRAIMFGLNHAFFTSLTGIGFAMARFHNNLLVKITMPLLGLAAAMFCHGLHNYLVGSDTRGMFISFFASWFGILWVFVTIVWSLKRQGTLIRQQLAEEVALGVLTLEQARRSASFSHRMSYGFELFGSRLSRQENDRRLGQLCAKLAFTKHEIESSRHTSENERRLQDLREQIKSLSRKLL